MKPKAWLMCSLPNTLAVIALALAPLSGEAACFLNCNCRDYHGYGSSRSYGPFNSTAACNAAVSSFTMQCRSGNLGHMFTATCMPGCFNCEPPAPPKAKVPQSAAPAADAQQSAWDKSLKEQEAAAQKQFQKDLESLKGGLKGVEVGNPNEIRLKAPPAADMAQPAKPSQALSEVWTPQQCEAAQQRVSAYRQALRDTVAVAKRLNKTIAADQQLRREWEETMADAVARAKDRGQFLWLALPTGKLERINKAASDSLDKNAGELADLLAETTDPVRRETIRGVRLLNAREKGIVDELGKTYKHIDEAVTLGGNAPLVFEDAGSSPTSPLHGDVMKLREAGEMLFGLMVERDKWKRLAANAPWAKYLENGLGAAFKAEAAARAMFDSWYDAFDAGLAWEQLFSMNLYADRYLEAAQKLGTEMRQRTARLKNAENEFAKECVKK